MRSFSPILSQTKISVRFRAFYISVSRLRSIHLKGIERISTTLDELSRGTVSESFTYTRLGHRVHLGGREALLVNHLHILEGIERISTTLDELSRGTLPKN